MKDIISDYFSKHHQGSLIEKNFFESRRTLQEAISYAALARDEESKFSHQYRVQNQSLEESRSRLLRAAYRIQACQTFHELYMLVESLILPVPGIGALTVYDTALRIGFWMRLEPEYIYLHAGTREGARNLGLPVNSAYLEMHQIPKALRNLTPDQIESIFCIYKNSFSSKAATISTSSRC